MLTMAYGNNSIVNAIFPKARAAWHGMTTRTRSRSAQCASYNHHRKSTQSMQSTHARIERLAFRSVLTIEARASASDEYGQWIGMECGDGHHGRGNACGVNER